MDGKEEKTIKNTSISIIIQEFSGQVKSINAERIKPIKPDIPKYKCQKEVNARQKAL